MTEPAKDAPRGAGAAEARAANEAVLERERRKAENDPEWVLGRVEFHRGCNRIERAVAEEGLEVRSAIGWTMMGLASWLMLAALYLVSPSKRWRT